MKQKYWDFVCVVRDHSYICVCLFDARLCPHSMLYSIYVASKSQVSSSVDAMITLHCMTKVCSGLPSKRINLSPFTKDFRGGGHLMSLT